MGEREAGEGLLAKVLWNYCERGGREAFWGEPLNAITNAAFIIAGLLLLAQIARQRRPEALSWALVILIILIGVGSFLFHTFATRWAGAADVIPIMLFMLTGVFTLARRGFDLPIWGGLIALGGFFALIYGASQLWSQLANDVLPGYFRGAFTYAPAGLVLLCGGGVVSASGEERKRIAGQTLLAAGLVFVVSLTCRTMDWPLCRQLTVGGYKIGLHFLWHVFNAITLYLTTRALLSLAPSAARP